MGTQGKKKEKVKRDFRQIRSAIIMVCVAVTVLGTSSYAWFTISNQPKVTGLALTAGATDGLKVSWTDEDAKFKNTITYKELVDAETSKVLSPVSPIDAKVAVFGEPVYTGDSVTGLKEITTEAEMLKYVAKYSIYLKSESTNTLDVCLKGGPTGADGNGTRNGCYVEKKAGGPDTVKNAPYSIRIGFKTGATWKIYEPNSDGQFALNTTTSATNGLGTLGSGSSGFVQNMAGDFVGNTSTEKSDVLLTIPGKSKVQVDMYIWLEGTDPECVNEIQADNLLAQIQFIGVKQAP